MMQFNMKTALAREASAVKPELISSMLFAVAKQAQQHHEHIDEVQVQ